MEPGAAVVDRVDRRERRDDVRQGIELALGERRLGDRVLLRIGPAVDHPRRNRQRNKALPYQAFRKVTASIESGHGRKAYR